VAHRVPKFRCGATRARVTFVTDPDERLDPRVARTRARALAAGQRVLVEEGLAAVTHLRVAEAAGVGRRTMYRHWPDSRALLHDVLALTRAPEPRAGDDLTATVVGHLVALEAALHEGPLAYILAALFERSTHDPEFESLRSELAAAGCRPLEAALSAAAGGELPADLDVDATVAMLEGPVVHLAIVRRRRMSHDRIRALVAAVLASPPRRSSARRPRPPASKPDPSPPERGRRGSATVRP
jgi:AcrR family transcriptional regulator